MYEIENALQSLDSYTVLLKGAPGTGKTTYAITLLEHLCQGDAKGVYISTRIEPSVLYKQFPGLESRVPPRNIVDATQSEFSESDQQVLYEDDTSFLRSVYGLVVEKDVTILIIDSWDAVSFQISKDNQKSIEKLENSMLDIARKTKTRLLLISECSGEKKLDYLVDSIIRLEKDGVDDRTVRKMYVDKLRGFRIQHRSYPFTLETGQFIHFEVSAIGLGNGKHKKLKRDKKNEIGVGPYYSTGITDLDLIIGGYPKGSFVLLELADDSISQSYRPVLFHTISNFMLNDCGVIYMPEEGSYSSSVKRVLSNYLDAKVLDKYLRMPTISETESEDICFFKINSEGGAESLKTYLNKHMDVYKGLKRPALHVIGLSRLDIYPEADIRGMLSEVVSWVRTTNDVLIGVLRQSAKLKNEIREMADVHLRFIPLSGTINVYGVKPHTLLYNISPLPIKGGYHELALTPFL